MSINDDDAFREAQGRIQNGAANYRDADPMARVSSDRKGVTLEAFLIASVLVGSWVNAGLLVWCGLSA